MNLKISKKKILWAVDAVDERADLFEKALQFIQSFAKSGPIEVEPVYILSPAQLGLPLEFSSEWIRHYTTPAQKSLESRFKEIKLEGLLPPKILTHHRPSLTGSVEVLSRYASTNEFDFIVAGSHSRKGLERLILGSFVETLLLTSKVPLTVISGNTKIAQDGKSHILFPVDLSDSTSQSFERVLDLASRLDARLTLLHVIPRPAEAVFQSGVYLFSGGWVTVPIFFEKEHTAKKQEIDRLAKKAAERKISVTSIIDVDSPSIVEGILNQTEKSDVSLIAMEAKSGAIEANLIGSVTRKILRAGPCPVWTFRL